MPTPFEARQRRRYVLIGIGTIIGSLVLTPIALDSIRTGIPIHQIRGPDTPGWLALAGIAFIIFLGLAAIAAGLGLITLRGTPRNR